MKKTERRWSAIAAANDMDSSFNFSCIRKKSNNVSDSLDVCRYRIIQNYAVNKVPHFTTSTSVNDTFDFDTSDPDGSGYVFDEPYDDLTSINMHDTLDVCNYRRRSSITSRNILNDNEDSFNSSAIYGSSFVEPNKTLAELADDSIWSMHSTATHSLRSDRRNSFDFDISHPKINQSNGGPVSANMHDTLDVCNYRRRSSITSTNMLNDNESSDAFNNATIVNTQFDELNKTVDKLDDTLDVCSYRCSTATPARCRPWIPTNFNKCIVPFSFLSPSPIAMANQFAD